MINKINIMIDYLAKRIIYKLKRHFKQRMYPQCKQGYIVGDDFLVWSETILERLTLKNLN